MSNTSSSGGIGFAGLLTIAFIVLKLAGFIAWSWWWVLSPLWITAALVATIIAVALLGMLVIDLLDKCASKRGNRIRAQRQAGRTK